jgi:hypothetical protein
MAPTGAGAGPGSELCVGVGVGVVLAVELELELGVVLEEVEDGSITMDVVVRVLVVVLSEVFVKVGG